MATVRKEEIAVSNNDALTEDSHEAALDLLLDPEAMLLAALLWASPEHRGATHTCGVLMAQDFYNTTYGHIFAVISDRRSERHATDPASIQAAFSALGSSSPVPLAAIRRILLPLATLGALPGNIVSYADQVLGTSYRRQFHAMTLTLAHAAESAPEEDLMEIMVAHGRAQREAWARRTAFRNGLDTEH